MKIKIREYEGWSLNNTNNMINFLDRNGILVLLSDRKIGEVEIIGLKTVIKEIAEMYKGLDIEVSILGGEYYENTDSIIIYNYYSPFNRIYKVTEYINSDIAHNAKDIICISYNTTARYNKSKWWRFRNKRKCDVVNCRKP